MKCEVDFQLRMSECPFNQYTKTKLRDKSYQEIHEERKGKISMDDLWKILLVGKEKDNQVNEVPEIDQKMLNKAFLITKAVPRQSNRSKWKEASGFAPNMLISEEKSGYLLLEDLVFSKDLDDSLVMFRVEKEVELDQMDIVISVFDFKNKTNISLPLNKLLTDQGLIAVIPSSLYKIKDDDVILSPIAEQLVQRITHGNEVLYTDIELTQLPESSKFESSAHNDRGLEGSYSPPCKRRCQFNKEKTPIHIIDNGFYIVKLSGKSG